jgi:hypothetical protein
MADREHPKFAIVSADVGKIQRISAEDLGSSIKIKPALRKRRRALDRIAICM